MNERPIGAAILGSGVVRRKILECRHPRHGEKRHALTFVNLSGALHAIGRAFNEISRCATACFGITVPRQYSTSVRGRFCAGRGPPDPARSRTRICPQVQADGHRSGSDEGSCPSSSVVARGAVLEPARLQFGSSRTREPWPAMDLCLLLRGTRRHRLRLCFEGRCKRKRSGSPPGITTRCGSPPPRRSSASPGTAPRPGNLLRLLAEGRSVRLPLRTDIGVIASLFEAIHRGDIRVFPAPSGSRGPPSPHALLPGRDGPIGRS